MAVWTAAIILSGCKIDEGSSFNPTILGYNMAIGAVDAMSQSLGEVGTIRKFNEYLSASDEEREAINDRYFYSSRIVEREAGQWHIIHNDRNELVILTHGTLLSDDGAVWNYYYYNMTYNDGEFPSIANLSEDGRERYEIRCKENSSGYSLRNRLQFTIEYTPYGQTSGGTTTTYEYIDVDSDSEQTVDGYYDLFTLRILAPLRYDTGKERFCGGRISTTMEIDGKLHSPETEFSERGITVWGGKDNAYSRTYEYRR